LILNCAGRQQVKVARRGSNFALSDVDARSGSDVDARSGLGACSMGPASDKRGSDKLPTNACAMPPDQVAY
jgi:hypothetical protein